MRENYNPENGIATMLEEWIGEFTNGGEICDMLAGPCACGATHHQYEWPDDVQEAVFGSVQVDEKWDRIFGRRKRRPKSNKKYESVQVEV